MKLLALSLCALAALAQPSQESEEPAAAPVAMAVVETAAGALSRTPLAGFECTDTRKLGGSLLRFEGLLELEPLAEVDESVAVHLLSGGRAYGLALGGEEEFFDLAILGDERLRLSIEEIARLVFPARIPPEWRSRLEPAVEGDLIYRRTGDGLDRIPGVVQSFDAEGILFETEHGERTYPWDELGALFVMALDDGTAPEAPPDAAPSVAVDLVDGSRLTGELIKVGPEGLGLKTPAGRGVRLVLPAIAQVLVQDGELSYLSDLAPALVEEGSPFGDEIGMTWPHRVDRSVSGGRLRASGRTWSRGLGVHAPSSLGWTLPGEWSELRGEVAVDDEVLRLAARGSVRFRVYVDGEQHWESPLLRGGDPPVRIEGVTLAGARELRLEVDMAVDLHVADRADWLGVVLVR